MMKKQALNPYLPVDTYIPDGEPHVFGDRVYIYGSHDKEEGQSFCLLDYEVWSAPVEDLSDWRREGIIYRKDQDPDFGEEYYVMFAPDVVQGNDGRYYLYYAMSGKHFTGPIHCAVCDSPAGKYEYYGCVQNKDGTPYTHGIPFDPAVINDEGVIRLYYGWSLDFSKEKMEQFRKDPEGFQPGLYMAYEMLFEKSREDVEKDGGRIMGGFTVELEDDMITVKTEPKLVCPGMLDAEGTSFEGHAFFEASSMRKIHDQYYFIYSSVHQHELCYAVSESPDHGFVYGGVIVDNGDIGYEGRKEENRLFLSGNNHGSLVQVKDQWYIFYHRQTHRNTFNRQGCAEKVFFDENGDIAQVEMTSCGLNDGPLKCEGSYPAVIACNLTDGHMPHAVSRGEPEERFPVITSRDKEQFIGEFSDGCMAGYKYFRFAGKKIFSILARGNMNGIAAVCADDELIGKIEVSPFAEWKKFETEISCNGDHALYIKFEGTGEMEIRDITFE